MRLILETEYERCLRYTPSIRLILPMRSASQAIHVIPHHFMLAAQYEPDRMWLSQPNVPHPHTWSGAEHNLMLPDELGSDAIVLCIDRNEQWPDGCLANNFNNVLV